MVERICPQCQHGNTLENRFCGRCGTPLEHKHLVSNQAETHLATAQSELPVQLKQVGKAVAISLVALAAEAGMAWLRQRVERMKEPDATTQPTIINQSAPPRKQKAIVRQSRQAPLSSDTADGKVTIWRQRVVQSWENGELTRQTVERTLWQRDS